MIRITVEVVPHGREADKYVIGKGKIVNDGTGTDTRGNYFYDLWYKGRSTRSGSFKNFPRKYKNVWRLILRCLMEAYDD